MKQNENSGGKMSEKNKRIGNSASAERSRRKDSKEIKRISRIQKYYLIPYQENVDLGKLAEEIIEIKGVQEVNIGDSGEGDKDNDYGLIVKTKHSKEVDSSEFAEILNKRIKGKYARIVSYYSVKK